MSERDQAALVASDPVVLDRGVVLALLRVYRTHLGVTEHYRGNPFIERVREALDAQAVRSPRASDV